MPTKTKPTPKAKTNAKTKAKSARMTLAEVMTELERAGSAQTRKTYARHGVPEPMFGVSFAALKTLRKRINVDHELALALWDTNNFDARNLAVKIADPARMTPDLLDRWAGTITARMCHSYVAYLAAEGPHGRSRAEAWLASPEETLRCAGWLLVGAMAMLDERTPDAWFADRLHTIEKTIHSAPNDERDAMNRAVISIGCHSEELREAATTTAEYFGNLEIDYGDTWCKTPDAIEHIDKAWEHSFAKQYDTPAAHERSRELMRTRC